MISDTPEMISEKISLWGNSAEEKMVVSKKEEIKTIA